MLVYVFGNDCIYHRHMIVSIIAPRLSNRKSLDVSFFSPHRDCKVNLSHYSLKWHQWHQWHWFYNILLFLINKPVLWWYRVLYLFLYNLYKSDVTDVTVVILLRLGAMGDITLYNIYIKWCKKLYHYSTAFLYKKIKCILFYCTHCTHRTQIKNGTTKSSASSHAHGGFLWYLIRLRYLLNC